MKFLFVLVVVITMAFCSNAQAVRVFGKADLTNFTSYADHSHEECRAWPCWYPGRFTFVEGKQTEEWVKNHSIIGVHHKDSALYKLKTFRISQGNHHIDAKVYDECADNDCDGCCTRNSKNTGFLINMEMYTLQNIGGHDGVVEWKCLDC